MSQSPSPNGQEPEPRSRLIPDRQVQVERSRLERLLHARLDGEISRHEAEELSELAARHPALAGEVRRTRLNLDHLVLLPPAPDFASRVLDRCAPDVVFSDRTPRRNVRRRRMALAGACAVAVLAVVATHRLWPGWNGASRRSEPLANVLVAAQQDLGGAASVAKVTGRQLVQAFGAGLREPGDARSSSAATRVARTPDRRLRLGDTSRFDQPLSAKASPALVMASQQAPGTAITCADDQWLLASFKAAQAARLRSAAALPMASDAMTVLPMRPRPFEVTIDPNSSDNAPSWPLWPGLAD
jgi:hypothetical protein